MKCGNYCRSLTSSSSVHGHIIYSCVYSKGKEDTGCFAGKADNKMLEHIILAEIKAYLCQNISQEQMNQKQFMEAKKQLEGEREQLQKRVQELGKLIDGEKEILMKKNVPVEQMLMDLGYEKLTREMLEEYVQGIYVYDDGSVEVEWKEK